MCLKILIYFQVLVEQQIDRAENFNERCRAYLVTIQ